MTDTISRGPFFIIQVAIFLGLLGLGIVLPLLPTIVEQFHASEFWIGALFAGYGLSRILLTPSIGSLSDKYGRKWFITGGLGIYALVSVWYIFPGSIYELFVIRFVHGIASAMITTVAMSYVADLTPEGEEGKYQGKLSNAFYLGMGCGPVIGGMVSHMMGMTEVFLTMAVMALIPFLVCIKYLPESMPKGKITEKTNLWAAFLHPRYIQECKVSSSLDLSAPSPTPPSWCISQCLHQLSMGFPLQLLES